MVDVFCPFIICSRSPQHASAFSECFLHLTKSNASRLFVFATLQWGGLSAATCGTSPGLMVVTTYGLHATAYMPPKQMSVLSLRDSARLPSYSSVRRKS